MISSNEQIFNEAKTPFQDALTKSGYNHLLKYNQNIPANKPKRRRKILWYNPPFSKNVQTNISKCFLHLIRKEFPSNHKLYKIFNRNTVKVSYCCMSNIQQTINVHNKNLLSTPPNISAPRECNCRNKSTCPMDNKCLTTSVIYQATVKTNNNTPDQTYIGLTEGTFKSRYTNHKASFNHHNKRNATELSKYIWTLKENNIIHNITWKVLRRAIPYNNISGKCQLCLWEKYYIIFKPHLGTLNKRSELISTCRHASKFLLRNSVT